jgi:ribokinase
MVVKSDKLPLPGQTLLGGTFFMNAGGKGANQAVAAARLGGSVTLVAKVGNDIFGKQAVEGLANESINTDYVFVHEDAASGTAIIMVDQQGENCIVVAPGANSNLLPGDLESVSAINDAEVVLVQLEIPFETIESVIQSAMAAGKKVILNPAPARSLNTELLDGLFLITPNETEASLLTGIQVDDQVSAAKAASFLQSKGVRNVIITLGGKGAYLHNDRFRILVEAPTVRAVDTTAAGDVFNGAIAVAIVEGMEWEPAVRFACRAASISVTRLGAQASAPYRNEV